MFCVCGEEGKCLDFSSTSTSCTVVIQLGHVRQTAAHHPFRRHINNSSNMVILEGLHCHPHNEIIWHWQSSAVGAMFITDRASEQSKLQSAPPDHLSVRPLAFTLSWSEWPLTLIFTARAMLCAVYSMALCLSVCLCLCLSVTSRCSSKTAKRDANNCENSLGLPKAVP